MIKVLKMTLVILLIWAAPVFSYSFSPVSELFDQQTGARIEVLLESRDTFSAPLIGVSHLLSHKQIYNLYQQRGFLPLWFDGWELKPESWTLMEHLRNAGAHGLCSNDYLLAELEGVLRVQRDNAQHNLPLAPDNRAVLDLFLSQAFLSFATHMVEGQVDPALAHVDWSTRRRKADLVKLLEYAMENRRMAEVIEELIPPHKGYSQLMAALAKYQEISALGGWPVIPPGPTIRPGSSDERVPLIRVFLQKTGDLGEIAATTPFYDAATREAMRLFQFRHGLVDDGVIGPKTLLAMNVSVEERVHQMELNLERWRWMPKSLGSRYIKVNIADFSLEVIEGDAIVLQMPVIVGTRYRKTPVFSAMMSYLEFAPYWVVPPTILREDKLPKIKHNLEYLREKHFNIISYANHGASLDPLKLDWSRMNASNFPGVLRMEPGPWNPLGRVKFMFPNSFDVYLHDTNETSLFANKVRSFSSGCIRVKRPLELARYLLGKGFNQKRLQALLAGTSPKQVSINPLPVHIQYWTAWVDPDGLVNFRPDVYYRDLDLDVALNEPAYRVIDQIQESIGRNLMKR